MLSVFSTCQELHSHVQQIFDGEDESEFVRSIRLLDVTCIAGPEGRLLRRLFLYSRPERDLSLRVGTQDEFFVISAEFAGTQIGFQHDIGL